MRAADSRKGAGGGICPVPETQPSQQRSWSCNFAATEVSSMQASSSSLPSAAACSRLSSWAPPAAAALGRE